MSRQSTNNDEELISSTWYKNIKARNTSQPKSTSQRKPTNAAHPHIATKNTHLYATEKPKTKYGLGIEKQTKSNKSSNEITNQHDIGNFFKDSYMAAGKTLKKKQKSSITTATMTIQSKPTSNKPVVSATLLAIANAVATKMTPAPKKQPENRSTPSDRTWKVVPSSKDNRSTEPNNFFHPKIIPEPTNTLADEPSKDNESPVCIRLKKLQHSNGKLSVHRTMLALLIAMQNINPSTNIRSINESDPSVLFNPNDIPTEIDELSNFFKEDTAMDTNTDPPNSNLLCFRIIIRSDTPLHKMKTNNTFTNWLKSENIQMDRNILTCMKPQQAGLLTHITVRSEITEVYEQRLQRLVSIACPRFMLQPRVLETNYAKTTIWNVMTAPDNVSEVTKELKQVLNTPQFRQYISWKEYNSLQSDQQLKVVQTQNTFSTDFRSLITTGYHDDPTTIMYDDNYIIEAITDETDTITGYQFINIEDNDMQDEEIDSRFYKGINLTTTTVTEFIQTAFISGDKSPVFAHVYEQENGIREVLVTRRHIAEAIDLIQVLESELCRIMNAKTMEYTFQKPANELMLQASTTEYWEPLDIQLDIEAASTAGLQKTTTQAKRRRMKFRNQPKRNYHQFSIHGENNRDNNNNNYSTPNQEYNNTAPTAWRSESITKLFPSEPTSNTETTALQEVTNELKEFKASMQALTTKVATIDTSIKKLDTKIDDVASNNQKEINILKEETQSKFNNLQIDTTKSLKSFTEAMNRNTTNAQKTTEAFLKELFGKQEEKINQNIKSILSNNSNTETDQEYENPRARKRPSIKHHHPLADDEDDNMNGSDNETTTNALQEITNKKPSTQTSLQKYLNLTIQATSSTLRQRSATPLPNKDK